jgi:hypothetical protein
VIVLDDGIDGGTHMLPVRTHHRDRATSLAFLSIAIVLAAWWPACAADDVPGWQNTRWGMTETEVKRALESIGLSLAALPAPLARSLGVRTALTTTVEMEGNYYDAILLFPDDARLGQVLVRTLDYSRKHALTLHGKLRHALVAKYGQPGESESSSTTASLARWTFKTTTVVLSMYTDTPTPARQVSQLAVLYAPTATVPEDPRDKLLGLGLLRALGEISRSAR